jgi:hypothetical protein
MSIAKSIGCLALGLVLAMAMLPVSPWNNQAIAQAPDENEVYLPLVTASSNEGDLSKIALELIARRNNIPVENLEIVNSAPAEYPLLGKTVFDFKVADNRSGEMYGVALNANGTEANTQELDAAEQAAHFARYGRLEPALAEALTNATGEPIKVILWLKEPPYVGPERPDPNNAEALASEAQQEAFFQQVDGQRAAAVQAVVQPVAARLTELGYQVITDESAPVMYAALSPNAIAQASQWEEVDTIYLDGTFQPTLEVARPTISADTVHSRGITGAGVKVAQIEVGGRVATSNPYLSGINPVIQDATYVCSSVSGHSTGVAGIIRSTDTARRGIAYGATLRAGGSCGGGESQLQDRSSAAVTWGARALNLSFGRDSGLVPGSMDRFYDGVVINNYRTVVPAAGNEADGCGSGTGNVLEPAKAYNVITVGNFDDKNTTSWSGDAMDPCSSWRDPSSSHAGGREKPEVSAPGYSINSTTTASPWTGGIGSGTSYAAPMVTGVAALMMQRNTALQAWPEAVKAILMATAWHNIEGSARLSEYDGAGGVVALWADDVVRRYGGSDFGGQSYTCSTATSLDVKTIYFYGGRRTRVVIAWDNDPNYAAYTSRPGADLELWIVNASGALVVSSASWENTYEIVDFTPSSSGYYKIRVYKYRCDYSPRWLGWAADW